MISHLCFGCGSFSQSFIPSNNQSLNHSINHSFIHSLVHSFFHSITYSIIHSFIISFIHSFILSFTYSIIHPFIHSFTHPFIHSFTHSFFLSFIHSFIHSFIFNHSFFHSFMYVALIAISLCYPPSVCSIVFSFNDHPSIYPSFSPFLHYSMIYTLYCQSAIPFLYIHVHVCLSVHLFIPFFLHFIFSLLRPFLLLTNPCNTCPFVYHCPLSFHLFPPSPLHFSRFTR